MNYVDISPRFDRIFLTIDFNWIHDTNAIEMESFRYQPHKLVFEYEQNDFIHWVNNTLINNDPWIAESE